MYLKGKQVVDYELSRIVQLVFCWKLVFVCR